MASLIITGANGNLGLTVVKRLLKDGYHLLAATGQAGAGTLPEDKNLFISEVDLLNEDAAQKFVETACQKNPDIQAAVLLVGGFAKGFRDFCYNTEQVQVFQYVPVENRHVFSPSYITEKMTCLFIGEPLDVFYQPFPAFVTIFMLFQQLLYGDGAVP